MLSFLLNFILMIFVVLASVKAYYDIPFLNENPKTSASVALVIIFLLIWIFPKILGFLIKEAIISAIIYAICNVAGWDLSFLKGDIPDAQKITEDAKKVTETISENVTDALNKVQDVVLPEEKFTIKDSAVVSATQLNAGKETIKLYGIDAPDMGQSCKNTVGNDYSCGEVAKEELYKFVRKNELSCEGKGKNRLGQKIAKCTVNGEDLSKLMVRSGWAVADRRITNDYIADEKYAHDNKIGLWSGKFHAPWEWRSKHSNVSDNKTNSKAKDTNKDTFFQKLMDFFKK